MPSAVKILHQDAADDENMEGAAGKSSDIILPFYFTKFVQCRYVFNIPLWD